SIQLTGIHALPFVMPDKKTKENVEKLVKIIIKNKEKNLSYDYTKEQKEIDKIIFNFHKKKFNFSDNFKRKLDKKFSVYNNYGYRKKNRISN
ncbi:MAG: hypothetical protein ACTSVV_15175, partial [Promethearchaeota archaeon]